MSATVSAAQAASTTAPKTGSRAIAAVIIASAVLALIGVVAWAVLDMGGFVATGMRNLAPWGLGIVCFMFFIGLSAGSLLVGVGPRALGMKGCQALEKPAVWLSISCAVAAGLAILSDLGNPLRAFQMIVGGNMASPLMWDMLALTAYLIVDVALLVVLLRNPENADVLSTVVCGWSIAAVVAAVALQFVEALIFSAYTAHVYWHTALMIPWFVSSALASGCALLMIVSVALKALGVAKLEPAALPSLAKWLGVFVAVDLFMLASDLATAAYGGGAEGAMAAILVSGPLSGFFWTQIVCYGAALVIAFVPRLRTVPTLCAAAGLVLFGTFSKRVQLLVGGFQMPNLTEADTLTQFSLGNWLGGMESAYSAIVYAPSMLEVALAIGLLGAAALVFFAGTKLLDL